MKIGVGYIQEAWAETLALALVLVGFFISLLITNTVLVYIVVILAGFLAGRILYIKKFKEPIFPSILMVVGFLFGYVLGSFGASRLWTTLFFIIGFGLSYYLHLKKFLVIFKKEEFIK
ncbi:hypothetical protein GOV03_03905 [Candidatus Woesearchaeota archaeon]|nr:hypothetical protein [Candidatus Woesearchaeota archaeon]